jgi:hypothetical protein
MRIGTGRDTVAGTAALFLGVGPTGLRGGGKTGPTMASTCSARNWRTYLATQRPLTPAAPPAPPRPAATRVDPTTAGTEGRPTAATEPALRVLTTAAVMTDRSPATGRNRRSIPAPTVTMTTAAAYPRGRRPHRPLHPLRGGRRCGASGLTGISAGLRRLAAIPDKVSTQRAASAIYSTYYDIKA